MARGEDVLSGRNVLHVDSGQRAAMFPIQSFHAIVTLCRKRLSGDSAVFPTHEGKAKAKRCSACFDKIVKGALMSFLLAFALCMGQAMAHGRSGYSARIYVPQISAHSHSKRTRSPRPRKTRFHVKPSARVYFPSSYFNLPPF